MILGTVTLVKYDVLKTTGVDVLDIHENVDASPFKALFD